MIDRENHFCFNGRRFDMEDLEDRFLTILIKPLESSCVPCLSHIGLPSLGGSATLKSQSDLSCACIGHAVGNAMSIPVVERIFVSRLVRPRDFDTMIILVWVEIYWQSSVFGNQCFGGSQNIVKAPATYTFKTALLSIYGVSAILIVQLSGLLQRGVSSINIPKTMKNAGLNQTQTKPTKT